MLNLNRGFATGDNMGLPIRLNPRNLEDETGIFGPMPLSIGDPQKLAPGEMMKGYRPGEAYDNRNRRLPPLMPLSVYGKPDEMYAEPLIHPSLNDGSGKEYEDIPLSAKASLMGNPNLQVPQSQKVKPGKAELQGRGLYKVDFPISKSLSARVGVAPNGNIVKRVKDPYIDKEKDMVYLRLNYHF
jgi:hypothetical protein